MYRESVLAFTLGDTVSGNRYIEKYLSEYKGNSAFEQIKYTVLGSIYSDMGILDKAEEYYRKELSLSGYSYNLSHFLIDNDRNINEGLELISNLLEINPNNYNILDTKGWGLYKQGKYKEALEVLQKSWDLRMKNAIYNHEAYLHLEAAKKAVSEQKSERENR